MVVRFSNSCTRDRNSRRQPNQKLTPVQREEPQETPDGPAQGTLPPAGLIPTRWLLPTPENNKIMTEENLKALSHHYGVRTSKVGPSRRSF